MGATLLVPGWLMAFLYVGSGYVVMRFLRSREGQAGWREWLLGTGLAYLGGLTGDVLHWWVFTP